MKKKHKLFFFLCCLILLLTACGGKKTSTSSSPSSKEATVASTSKQTEIKKSKIPTVFFHGYQGTRGSFGHMLQRMEDDGYGKQELVLTVAVDGSVTAEGELSGKANNPFVQVLFADNENNEWNQADWVKAVLIYLQTNYAIEQVNVVGHSMGGVSSFRYLTAYGYDNTLPQINKFVAMGAPFNEFVDSTQSQSLEEVLANGPTELSTRYTDFQSGITNIPKQIRFLLIAGQLSDSEYTDGTVPLTSALAVHGLLKNNANPVDYQIFMQTKHSGLHESTSVDKAVEHFLWE